MDVEPESMQQSCRAGAALGESQLAGDQLVRRSAYQHAQHVDLTRRLAARVGGQGPTD